MRSVMLVFFGQMAISIRLGNATLLCSAANGRHRCMAWCEEAAACTDASLATSDSSVPEPSCVVASLDMLAMVKQQNMSNA